MFNPRLRVFLVFLTFCSGMRFVRATEYGAKRFKSTQRFKKPVLCLGSYYLRFLNYIFILFSSTYKNTIFIYFY